jgi:hypothetical protein
MRKVGSRRLPAVDGKGFKSQYKMEIMPDIIMGLRPELFPLGIKEFYWAVLDITIVVRSYTIQS